MPMPAGPAAIGGDPAGAVMEPLTLEDVPGEVGVDIELLHATLSAETAAAVMIEMDECDTRPPGRNICRGDWALADPYPI
ncbi:MAG TPA: hypothetical protein VHU82_03085 [Vicinamibacterales bacterium]|jgi:hypothetical protein|nr:hypothetical protein [Vicinamibacterales bacterium]